MVPSVPALRPPCFLRTALALPLLYPTATSAFLPVVSPAPPSLRPRRIPSRLPPRLLPRLCRLRVPCGRSSSVELLCLPPSLLRCCNGCAFRCLFDFA